MATISKRLRLMLAGGLLALGTGAFAAPVAASTVTVTLPCGCSWSVENQGRASDTPAIDNGSSLPGSDVKPFGAVVTFTP
jgi:hypothetical protein